MVGTVRLCCVAVGCSLLASCSLPYYWQAVGGQLRLLGKREPIEAVLEDPSRDAELKDTLRAVLAMRRFAVERLGLPDNDSYRSYADLERRYVVWNVIAAEEFSIEPVRWCFIVVGCVSYRGFFEQQDAERFAARLSARGLETFVAGASAYSTLGFFDDPLLSTMLVGGKSQVAGVLFHELAHQQLYIKDDSDLSEAFATAVEEHGTELWLAERGDPAELERYRRRTRFRVDFTSLVLEQQQRLRAIFTSGLPVEDKREAKLEAYRRMRADYDALKRRWGGYGLYDGWFEQPPNNARLAAVATYLRWVPGLRWQIERLGLPAFYRQMASLAESPPAERQALLESWLASALSARRSAAAPTASADAGAATDSAALRPPSSWP